MANSRKNSDCCAGFILQIPSKFSVLNSKFLTLLCTCALLLFNISAPAQAKYGGGTGEPNDPYLIYTAEQMNAIGADSNDWDKHFKLMADIDLSDFVGTSFNIIGYYVSYLDNKPFKGVFDGNGHTLSSFTYIPAGTEYVGLFGCVSGENAEIRNLGLINPNIYAKSGHRIGSLVVRNSGRITNCYVENGSVTGDFVVGGLVGSNWQGTISNCYSSGTTEGLSYVGGLVAYNQRGTITDCHSTSNVSGHSCVGSLLGYNWQGTISNCYSDGSAEGVRYVGGLVAYNQYGTISECYSTVDVFVHVLRGGMIGYNFRGTISNCYSSVSASGYNDIGSLVGFTYSGTITNCYSTGSVAGNERVGGLVGYNSYCTITNCYSSGRVSGIKNVGGMVGWTSSDRISNSFWDIETSGQTSSAGGTGKTTAEMQMQITFTDAGWDFNTPVWTIDEGVDYPRLRWETPLMHAEPEVTLGTSNTISWDPVVGAIEYYAECAEDANFTSIVYNSGWITETSYGFVGLELGQRYWYSVKARNAAGVETNWSNVESSLQCTLADAVDIELAPESLKNENLKDALLNKINVVLEMIDEGLYENALSKLENDILQKMNGCCETGEPDKNDWIITCEEQSQVYPLVMEIIEYVKGLMGG